MTDRESALGIGVGMNMGWARRDARCSGGRCFGRRDKNSNTPITPHTLLLAHSVKLLWEQACGVILCVGKQTANDLLLLHPPTPTSNSPSVYLQHTNNPSHHQSSTSIVHRTDIIPTGEILHALVLASLLLPGTYCTLTRQKDAARSSACHNALLLRLAERPMQTACHHAGAKSPDQSSNARPMHLARQDDSPAIVKKGIICPWANAQSDRPGGKPSNFKL